MKNVETKNHASNTKAERATRDLHLAHVSLDSVEEQIAGAIVATQFLVGGFGSGYAPTVEELEAVAAPLREALICVRQAQKHFAKASL